MRHELAGAVALLALTLTACKPPGPGPNAEDWRHYREAYISPEGRVIDTGQGGISHSEGQGYGMLLAERYADRETFQELWDWTRTHLAVREDGLLAWRWDPGQGRVTDTNNASDGDLLVAWALLRAHHRWHEPAYRDEALRLAVSVRRKLFKRDARGLLLLPGVTGFETPEGTIVNLSYWIFPAIEDLGRLDPHRGWRELERSGFALLDEARFGEHGLPPDWLLVGEHLGLPSGFPHRFGYDAVRIPLYLVWSGRGRSGVMARIRGYWRAGWERGGPSAWIDLDSGSEGEAALPSFGPVLRLAGLKLDGAAGEGRETPAGGEQAYYFATLRLLADLAAEEGRRRE